MKKNGVEKMEFLMTKTEKYKNRVKAQASIIELAKVECMQEIARQLETLNVNIEGLRLNKK